VNKKKKNPSANAADDDVALQAENGGKPRENATKPQPANNPSGTVSRPNCKKTAKNLALWLDTCPVELPQYLLVQLQAVIDVPNSEK
jgi:hypothetical protein